MKLRNRIAGVCALCGVAVSATAETVEYWDPVGKVTNSVEAVVVTASTATLTGGWYVVKSEVSRAQIEVTGTDASPANLILADGAKLTVDLTRNDSRVDHCAALHVPTGKALSIWATREGGTGAIEATGRYQGAGIGGQADDGSYVEACGTVSIYGGNVTAIGSMYAAGIGGGGDGADGGTITISGGTVIARSGNRDVGDIGSGSGGADSGEFVVKGGSVLLANSGKCRDGYPACSVGFD